MDLVGAYLGYRPLLSDYDFPKFDGLFNSSSLLYNVKNEITDFFREALKTVGIYHSFNKFFYPDLYESDVQQLHQQLAQQFGDNLSSVTSSGTEPALFDRNTLLSITEKLAIDANELVPEATAQIITILRVLKTSQADHFNIKEWAHLSLMLDTLSAKWEKTPVTGHSLRKQFVGKIIDYLKLAARLQSHYLAREKIISILEEHYKKVWKLGYSRFESHCGSAGVATPFSELGISLGVSINQVYEETHAIDDEGYYTEYDLGRTGLSANVKAGLPTTGFATTKAGGTLAAQSLYGYFGEWASPRAYAIHQFNALIEKSKHRNNPEIARYLSRSRLLASDIVDEKLDLELLNGLDEGDELIGQVNQLKRDFDQRKKDMEQQLSIYLGKAYTFSPIKISSSNAIQANVTGSSVKLAINAEAKLGLDMDTEESIALISVSAIGSGERMKRVRHDQRHTPIGARWADPLKMAQEKTSIKQQLGTQLQVFQKTLSASWKKEYALAQQFTDKQVTLDVEFKKENSPLNFQYLKQDFEEYTRLQAGMVGRDCRGKAYQQDQEVTLRNFEKRYGAHNPEQLIHRMVIANAYLLTHTQDEGLKAEMLAFEQTLLHPSFAVDRAYLKEYAYFVEDIDFETLEHKFELELKLGVPVLSELSKFKFKLNATHMHLEHTNILRRGDYGTFTITIGGEVNIKDAVSQMAPHLYEHIPGDFGQEALQLLERDLSLIAPTGSFGAEKTYVWRFARPHRFSDDSEAFSLNRYFFRELGSSFAKAGTQIAIPTGVVDLTLGTEYINIQADPLTEQCYSDTLFYFATLCMHEYQVGTIDKKTREVADGSHWKTIVQEQKEALAQLFKNYVKENSNIAREIEEIRKAIERNKNYSKQLTAIYGSVPTGFCDFISATGQLKEASEEYAANPSDGTYQHALTCFEQLMHAYYPQWIDSKNNSVNYKPRQLAAVEDITTNLMNQIWQSQLMQLAA